MMFEIKAEYLANTLVTNCMTFDSQLMSERNPQLLFLFFSGNRCTWQYGIQCEFTGNRDPENSQSLTISIKIVVVYTVLCSSLSQTFIPYCLIKQFSKFLYCTYCYFSNFTKFMSCVRIFLFEIMHRLRKWRCVYYFKMLDIFF